jgi:hypothetical protein
LETNFSAPGRSWSYILPGVGGKLLRAGTVFFPPVATFRRLRQTSGRGEGGLARRMAAKSIPACQSALTEQGNQIGAHSALVAASKQLAAS